MRRCLCDTCFCSALSGAAAALRAVAARLPLAHQRSEAQQCAGSHLKQAPNNICELQHRKPREESGFYTEAVC